MRYDPHKLLIAPARPSASLQLLAVGVVMTVLLYLLISYLVWSVLGSLVPFEIWASLTREIETARTPATVLINLYTFGLLGIALGLSLKLFHQRSLQSLVGSIPLAIFQFRKVGVVLLMLFVVVSFLPTSEEITPERNLGLARWLGLLPLALLGLLIQTSTEELVFRGYLQSQLAARFSHPVVWIGLPSALFAWLHYDPSLPASNAWIIMLWAGLFGAVTADLTARSGTLGPAIAFHMINNFSAVLIAAPTGHFDGLALFTYPFSLASSDALLIWAPVDLMLLFCGWLAARLALQR